MTQPSYRFLENVDGISSDGADGDVYQFSAGEYPTAEQFNGNTNIAFAVLANLDNRMSSIDGISAGGSYDADETIFSNVTTTFSSLIDIIEDIKGGNHNWYTAMDTQSKSLQKLYERNTWSSGIEVSDSVKTNKIENLTGNTLTISASDIDIVSDDVTLGTDGDDDLTINSTVTFNAPVHFQSGLKVCENGTTNYIMKEFNAGIASFSTPTDNIETNNIAHNLGDTPTTILLTLQIEESVDLEYDDLKDISLILNPAYGNTYLKTVVTFPNSLLAGGTKEINAYHIHWAAFIEST